jgi:hypothetical protein
MIKYFFACSLYLYKKKIIIGKIKLNKIVLQPKVTKCGEEDLDLGH